MAMLSEGIPYFFAVIRKYVIDINTEISAVCWSGYI